MIKIEDNFTSDPEFHYEMIENEDKTFTLSIMNVLAYDTDIDAVRKCNIIIPNYEPYSGMILTEDDSNIVFSFEFLEEEE